MTSSQLQLWIEHPEYLNKETLYELRNLLARYPYFQTLRLLYLKNLYVLHDIAFGAELRKAVLYVADRRVLFYLIEGDRYTLPPHKLPIVSDKDMEEEPGIDRTLFLIDTFLATVPEEHLPNSELDYSTDYTAYLVDGSSNDEDALQEAGAETPRLRGQDLIDGFLRMSEEAELFQPEYTLSVDEGNEGDTDELPRNETEAAPAECPLAAGCAEALAAETAQAGQAEEPTSETEHASAPIAKSEELDDSCFTETLAKIYVKQGRYDKALEIIKKLSLNYPKKNAYFADQIRFLEKLIINAKSK